MGGKSRKTGTMSKKLLEKITGNKNSSIGQGKPPGLLNRGGLSGFLADFSPEANEEKKKLTKKV